MIKIHRDGFCGHVVKYTISDISPSFLVSIYHIAGNFSKFEMTVFASRHENGKLVLRNQVQMSFAVDTPIPLQPCTTLYGYATSFCKLD